VTFPQVTEMVRLEDTDYCWRTVPGVWGFEAHPDGRVQHEWKTTGTLHPVEGFVVPVSFEGAQVLIPARYLVAAAHLEKPGQVLIENGRGGLAWLYDVARRNGDWRDDSAQNLYWHELPEPVDFDWLMRQPPQRRARGVLSGPKGKPESDG
jgi:hypothetical protein